MRIAFLGIGTMGAPMALNLAKKGHALTVWNRTHARAQAFAAAAPSGVSVAATPREAAREAELVVTMLADPAAVERAALGPDGYLASLRAGAIAVDMSTVDPALARKLDGEARARGAHFLDAPVSGTRKPAEDGTLLIMAGGDEDVFARARPALEAMGRPRRMGPVGQGMAMKLVLNGLGAHMMTGFAAVLTLGRTQGLATDDMLAVIGGGAFSSPLYAGKGPRIKQRDFRPDFTVALMRKDQDLVLRTAASVGFAMPTLAAIRDVLDQAIAAGYGELDLSGVVRLFEDQAGVLVDGT